MALNLNKLKSAVQNADSAEKKAGIGQGLLNSASKNMAAIPENEKTVLKKIPIDRIKMNEKNKYSQGDIEDLAENILMLGQFDPLTVTELDGDEDYDYLLISGERRSRAVKMLYEADKHSRYVDAYIRDLDAIDLRIPKELKEEFMIISPNAKRRNNTEYDNMMEAEKLEKIYTALREAGYKEIFGQKIEGKKTRELIAETMGVSDIQVQKYQNVNKKGTEFLYHRMQSKEEPISINLASKIAELPEQDQNVFLSESEGKKITPKALSEFAEKKATEPSIEDDVNEDIDTDKEYQDTEDNVCFYTLGDWKLETKPITQILKAGVQFNDEERAALDDAVNVIKGVVDPVQRSVRRIKAQGILGKYDDAKLETELERLLIRTEIEYVAQKGKCIPYLLPYVDNIDEMKAFLNDIGLRVKGIESIDGSEWIILKGGIGIEVHTAIAVTSVKR